MIETLIQIALSNTFLALVLAAIALAVGARSRRPHLAHALWVLVLIKLVTPPLVSLPVVEISTSKPAMEALDETTRDEAVVPAMPHGPMDEFPVKEPPLDLHAALSSMTASAGPRLSIANLWRIGQGYLIGIWCLGSGVVLVLSIYRVIRFDRLLRVHTEDPSDDVAHEAARLSRQLGLRSVPDICVTSARLNPMVWWAGGRVKVVIPRLLLGEMRATQWRWVLAHELGHVRRRDYLVRWLEWLACVALWWNPIVWLALRKLRAAEEICCDALVLSCMKPGSQQYARSIFGAVESLAYPDFRPPAMASEVNSGGSLERRIEMILSGNLGQNSTVVRRVVAMVVAACVIPFGFAKAQDVEAVSKRLAESVIEGEITLEQAAVMIEALEKTSEKQRHMEMRREGEMQHQTLDRWFEAEGEGTLLWRADGQLEQSWWSDEQADEAKVWLDLSNAKLQEAFEAGLITEEEMKEKLDALKNEFVGRTREMTEHERSLDEFHQKLRQALEQGYISPEEYFEKLDALKLKLEHESDQPNVEMMQSDNTWRSLHADFHNEQSRIMTLIDEGYLSREEALDRIIQLNEKLKAETEAEAEDDFTVDPWQSLLDEADEKMKAAIEAGLMTPEERYRNLDQWRIRIRN